MDLRVSGPLVLLLPLLGLCAADLCNWRGSGLAREPHSRTVQQVRLRCTEGQVEWFYPSQALRVLLQPNLASARPATVCIKPLRSFRGASVFIERAGELELLLAEGGLPEQVYCFRTASPQQPAAVFLQASPHSDISRRTVGFRYELLGHHGAQPDLRATVVQAVCRPCNDTELLLAVCSSDFVVRGSIQAVSHDEERQTSRLEVGSGHVYRQRSGVFERDGAGGSGGAWKGYIHTLLQCGVRQGDGEFLFMGAEHFGEAWLGCAPRYKDFLSVYGVARAARENPCEFPLD